jgi:hypothetical protein
VAQLFILSTELFLTRPSGAKWGWGENGTLTKNLFGLTARQRVGAQRAREPDRTERGAELEFGWLRIWFSAA